ncbi:hypothetical protein OG787_20630 [Streptomyces sp. NBC_00075]|uniref:hypothetical protein n=1 Tax=Streptomyces sp. NBC_00075 TaxID=2975641 RepID=UPI00324D5350
MGNYVGAAVVIADGTDYEVHADLWCRRDPPRMVRSFGGPSPVGGGGISWGGTLTASGELDAFAMHDASTLTLRVEDGTEAAFTFGNGGDIGKGVLTIRGSGTVPFDCN